MSPTLSLDSNNNSNNKLLRMNLRPSTVNQRSQLAGRIRKSAYSAAHRTNNNSNRTATLEKRSSVAANGSSESSTQTQRCSIDCVSSSLENVNRRKFLGNSDSGCLHIFEECEKFKRPRGDAYVSCKGGMIDNIGQLSSLDIRLSSSGSSSSSSGSSSRRSVGVISEKNKATRIVDNNNKGNNHHDLRNTSSEHNFTKPTTRIIGRHSEQSLIASSQQQTPVVISSKRMKSNNFRDLIESHSIEDIACSCKINSLSQKGRMDNPEITIPKIINTDTTTTTTTTTTESQLPTTERVANHFDYPNHRPRDRILAQPHKLVHLGERNGRTICNKHMPWFGIDVGGSLVKVVFFDPKDATKEETITLKRIRRYLKSSKAYGTTGKRDAHLEMTNCKINERLGTLHFIRFATNQMPNFLAMAKSKRFADTINNVCATGGGAYKFEEDIKTNLNITLHKTDELDSIIHGIHYIDKYNSERECYFLKDPLDDTKCVKVPYDFSQPYPYLVVNIGSGVSILAVYSSTQYSRVGGSSIGGGTFLGLCCLLTQCKTFDEAIRLANNGSSTKIDKLVKDIYGGDYPKFDLSGDTVASSFGHMNVAEKRKDVKREDLARALLEMVTINIGSLSRMCARDENIDRVVFIGNFLRVNQLSMKLLSYAVNYWSKGAMKALFLEHEGYFGAVGCFVESTQGMCHH